MLMVIYRMFAGLLSKHGTSSSHSMLLCSWTQPKPGRHLAEQGERDLRRVIHACRHIGYFRDPLIEQDDFRDFIVLHKHFLLC